MGALHNVCGQNMFSAFTGVFTSFSFKKETKMLKRKKVKIYTKIQALLLNAGRPPNAGDS